MQGELLPFRGPAVDEAAQELLLPPDEENEHTVEGEAHVSRAEPTTESAPLPGFPTLSFYDGYQSLNGIPVRRIGPSNATSKFTCHAFSFDGSRFVTGETNGTIRLWTTKNYSLVFETDKAFGESKVKHVSFVEEKEDSVAAVDERGVWCIINLTTVQPEEGTSSSTSKTLKPSFKYLNKKPSRMNDGGSIIASHLSNEGRTFACCRQDDHDRRIHLYRDTGEKHVRRSDLSFHPFQQCFPFVSGNGCSLLACCLRPDVEHTTDAGILTDMQCCVLLWPNLEIVKDETPGIELEGDKAIWGLDGEYLLVWKSFEQTPKLLVYETSEFRTLGESNKPFEIDLGSDLCAWNARMMKPCNPGEMLRILVYEIEKTGSRRVKIWNLGCDEGDKAIHLTSAVNIIPSHWEQLSTTIQAEQDSPGHAVNGSTHERYLALVQGTTLAKFSATDDCKWIGSYLRMQNCWDLIPLYSGVSAWRSKPPNGNAGNECWKKCETVFDPLNQQLLLISRHAIMACAPSFLRPACTQCITKKKPTPSSMLFKGNQEESALMSRVLQSVASTALAKILIDELTKEQSRTFSFRNLSLDRKSFSSVKDAAVCSNGDSLAFIARTTNNVSRVLVAKRSSGRRSGGCSSFSTRLIVLDDGEVNIPERVFLHDTDQYKSAILIHRKDELFFVSFYKLWTLEKPRTINLEMDKCFCASQSSDGEQVVILGPDSVCTVHLDSGQKERVMYKANMSRLFEALCVTCESQSESMRGNQIFENRLSPDGRTVLLGWDSKNKKGIFLTPTMSTAKCEESIAAAEGCLSQYCALSGNGKLTLFLDVEDTCMSEILVGIFCNSKKQILHRVLAAGASPGNNITKRLLSEKTHLLLSNVFFGLSKNGDELMVAITECKDEDDCGLTECIKRFSVYGTEECIPDYERLTAIKSDAQAIRVKRLFDKFGGSVVNAPSADQCCLLHRAVKFPDKTLIDQILRHAQEKNVHVTLECASAGSGPFNPLQDALRVDVTNDIDHIKTSLMLLYSPQSPFDRAARMFKENFQCLVKKHRDIIEDAFSTDSLIRKFCAFKTHLYFMDQKKREDSADHIDTWNSFGEWASVRAQNDAAKKWNDTHKKVLERMEKDGEKSTTDAELSFISIEDAAKPGMQGILRPLLLAAVPVSIFECEAVKSVIMFKWCKIWRTRTFIYLGIYCVFLGVLTLYTVDVVSIENKSNPGKVRFEFSLLLLGGLVGFGVYFLLEEGKQLITFMQDGKEGEQGSSWTGAKYFFNSKWNWVDLLSCALLVVCLPICHVGGLWEKSFDVALAICLALESILAYLKIWYFAQPFRHTGSLVSLVHCVITDCMSFILLAAVVLVGFGFALYSLFGHLPIKEDEKDKVHEAFGSLRRSFLTLFFALFGEFDGELYSLTKSHSWMVTFTFSFYLFSETIVLLNLFIAILGDTYDKVKNSQEAHLMMRRAQYIDSREAALSDAERKKMEKRIGKYVSILLRPDGSNERKKSAIWLGRINAIENIFKNGIAKSQNLLKTLIADTLKKIEDVKSDIQRQIEMGMFVGIQKLVQCFHSTAGETRQKIEDLNERVSELAQQMNALQSRVDAMNGSMDAMNGSMASHLDTLISLFQNQQGEE